jgi:hypothetical protein
VRTSSQSVLPELGERGEQLGPGREPGFVAGDHLRAGAVAANLEIVAPFRGAPDVHIVAGALAVNDERVSHLGPFAAGEHGGLHP